MTWAINLASLWLEKVLVLKSSRWEEERPRKAEETPQLLVLPSTFYVKLTNSHHLVCKVPPSAEGHLQGQMRQKEHVLSRLGRSRDSFTIASDFCVEGVILVFGTAHQCAHPPVPVVAE